MLTSREPEILEIYRVAEQETASILKLYCRLLQLEHGPRITHFTELGFGDRARSTVPGPVLTWVMGVRKVLLEPKHRDHWVWTYRRIVLSHRYERIAKDADKETREVRRAIFSSVMYMAARRRDLDIPMRPE